MFEEMKIRHLLGITALFSILLVIVLVFLLTFSIVDENFASFSSYLVYYVLIPLIFFGYHIRKQGFSVRQVVFIKDIKRWIPSLFGIVFVSIAFSLSAFWLLLYSLNPILPLLVDFLMEGYQMPESGLYLGIEIIGITVLAPIVEEFVFRGVILQRLIGKSSVWGGVLISSLLFGILHADVIGAFLFGIIASLLFIRTGNLLIPILMHAINNTIAVIFMFVAPAWPKSVAIIEKSDIVAKAFPNLVMLIISTILTGYIVFRLGKGIIGENTRKNSIKT